MTEVTSRNDYPFEIELPVIFDPESADFATNRCPQPWSMACFNDKGHVANCCYMDHSDSIGNMFQNYKFNSEKIIEFRKRMSKSEYPEDSCLLCHRRFMGQEHGVFYANQGKWNLQGVTGARKNLVHLSPLA